MGCCSRLSHQCGPWQARRVHVAPEQPRPVADPVACRWGRPGTARRTRSGPTLSSSTPWLRLTPWATRCVTCVTMTGAVHRCAGAPTANQVPASATARAIPSALVWLAGPWHALLHDVPPRLSARAGARAALRGARPQGPPVSAHSRASCAACVWGSATRRVSLQDTPLLAACVRAVLATHLALMAARWQTCRPVTPDARIVLNALACLFGQVLGHVQGRAR